MNKSELPIKETIIKTTKELLIKKGNVTIKEIADAAFINVAAINYHFQTKDNLIQVVIEEVISELRAKIIETIKETNISQYKFEEVFSILLEIIFTFAEKNAGIINFSFLQMATQSKATNVLVEFFILDKEFISIMMQQLASIVPNAKEEVLFSKYLILFSSFVVPFFLSFSGWYPILGNEEIKQKAFFERYRKYYLEELQKVLYA